MTYWQAVILGLVEGITEYLPVSSTGHLIIAGDLLGLGRTPTEKAALDAFNIVIQGGAILAVLLLYLPRFTQMLRGLLGLDPAGLRLFINISIAFLPAAVVGLLLKKAIEAHLFHIGPVVAALIVGGVFMIAIDRLYIRRQRVAANLATGAGGLGVEDLTPARALVIGLLQILAMWPGTSRSMMTISGGVMVGLRPAAAAEFSFLLGMPTLLAATLYSLYKNLKESRDTNQPNLFEVFGYGPAIVGLAVAAVSAALAVHWLVGFLNRHGLTPFGIYRIALGLLLLALGLAGWVTVD
jgi:undecaprenyl-diphosphatase